MSTRRKLKIVLADEDKALGKQLENLVKDAYQLFQVADPVNLYAKLVEETPAFLFLDTKVGKTLDILRDLSVAQPNLLVIILASAKEMPQAQAAVKAGAFGVLAKPLEAETMQPLLRHAADVHALRTRIAELEQLAARGDALDALIGESEANRRLREQLELLAGLAEPVLLVGADGTPKELAARAIHDRSSRKRGPFISFHVGAFPANVAERLLFGAEKGAFGDAALPGALDLAKGGTLFIDDVHLLDAGAQQRLLKLLASDSFAPVGTDKAKEADVRVVAATSEDLAERAKAGRFRKDLQEKLQLHQTKLAALRDRKPDVAALARRRLCLGAARNQHAPLALSSGALDRLTHYDWPGNDRQLETMLDRVACTLTGDVVEESHLPSEVTTGLHILSLTAAMLSSQSHDDAGLKPIELVERKAIIDALARTNGHVGEASKLLGYGQATVYRKVKRYGITPEMRGKPKRGRKPKFARPLGAEPQSA